MFIDIEDSMDIPIYPDPYGKKISFCVRGGVIKFSSVENFCLVDAYPQHSRSNQSRIDVGEPER